MNQRVIMTVGCPGSGKTTFARSLDPMRWITMSLDDFRAALWGSKKAYHRIVNTDDDPSATHALKMMLHEAYFRVLKTALVEGWSVCMANTHLDYRSFRRELGMMRRLGIFPTLRVYSEITLDELIRRNAERPECDRVPVSYLIERFAALHDPDAWWRSYRGPIEIVPFTANDNREAA